jgi:hypothetical protein
MEVPTLEGTGEWEVTSTLSFSSRRPKTCLSRGRRFDATCLPVPADVLVYTEEEWARLTERTEGLGPIVWID